jgi:hypothetical protein
MASTYVNDLRLNEMATGDGSGTWGTTTNTNLELIAEAFSYGTEVITTNADTHTTTIADGATDPGRSLYLKYTGTLDSACTITIGPNTVSKVWIIENGTSGSQDIILSQGSGANVTIPNGDTKIIYTDGAGAGAAVTDAFANLKVTDPAQTNITSLGTLTVLTGGTGDLNWDSGTLFVDSSANNVGIGTTSVGTKLNIRSDASDDGILLEKSDGTDIARLFHDGTSTNARFDMFSGGSATVQIKASGDTHFSGGNVGIGTSSPVGRLSVIGTDNTTQAVFGGATGTTGRGLRIAIDQRGGTFNLDAILDAQATVGVAGNLVFQTQSIERVRIDASGGLITKPAAGGHAVFNENSVDADFRVESNTSTHALFVDGGTSRVGINKAAPDRALDVHSGSASDITTFANDAGSYTFGKSANMGSLDLAADASFRIRHGATESVRFGPSETTFNEGGADLDFRVESDGNANMLFVDGGANAVGIGTGAPLSLLQLAKATIPSSITRASNYLQIGGSEEGLNGYQVIGFGYNDSGRTYMPAYIGFKQTVASSGNAGDLIFGTRADGSDAVPTERARLTKDGNLLVGTTSGSTHIIKRAVSVGSLVLEIIGNNLGTRFFNADGGSPNAGNSAQHVYSVGATGRSINAAGTVNASGADYAEYMKKSDSCGTIAKGDVCGVDSTGKLTDVFENAISFVIKSTNPSYVGGDAWGGTELGLTEEQYETERQKYDRIAFSGQVPVNITGSFNVGDYVYPQVNGTAIECVAKSSPTFEEYQLCVGKIWATQDDGRPFVAVKIG